MTGPVLAGLLSDEEWLVRESGFDPARANVWETLFTVGNGRLGTRGTLEEGHEGQLSGTYLAGVYDRHDSPVVDLVNVPDWLDLDVTVDGVRLDVATCTVLEHERALDLRHGVLWRRTVFADAQGRRTQLESVRTASLQDRSLVGLRLVVTPDHDADVVVTSGLDGRRRNLDRLPVYVPGTVFDPEVRWEKWAASRHLHQHRVVAGEGGATVYLETSTIDSGIELGFAASTSCLPAPQRSEVVQRHDAIRQRLDVRVPADQGLVIDKIVAIATSREGEDVALTSTAALADQLGRGLDALLTDSAAAWERRWRDCDARVVGDPTATHAVRFGIYQLLIAANPEDPTVNIGAKSMTGEGYRGHVFWDTEILMLPFFVFTQPETARALLRYRHHTLPGARALAKESGTAGARYPWESADTGAEECPMFTNDGAFRFWTRDEEIHVSADVAYGIATYLDATGDHDFLVDHGAEILFETARFWVDRVEQDPASGRCSLRQVMGPDEFHSHVDDNAFTNELARWNLEQAVDVHADLSRTAPDRLDALTTALGLQPVELTRWREVADGLAWSSEPSRDDGVIEQFAGYLDRLDVPITVWDENAMPRYPEGYHHFNCEDTMLLKQPDVVMLMHMLPERFSPSVKKANFEFYEARTLHKSSLSPAVHAIMGLEVGDTERAEQYFLRSALVDLADNQGNTAEGIHIASAGGTWQILVHGFAGFRVRHGAPAFDPWLPAHWEAVELRLQWRGAAIDVRVDHRQATFLLDDPDGTAPHGLDISVQGRPLRLPPERAAVVALS